LGAVHDPSVEVVPWGERHGVQEEVEPPPVLRNDGEDLLQLSWLPEVAR